jgi:hypothetical protein
VVTLNRSLPTPIVPGETTTTTTSPGSGDSEPTGLPVQLSELTITGDSNGVLTPGFSSAISNYTYTTSVDTVTVKGTPRLSSYVVRYKVGDGAFNTAANGVSVTVPATSSSTVVIRVNRSSSSSSASREYTVVFSKPGSGTGTQWEQVSKVNVSLLRKDPTIDYYRVNLELTIASSYVGQYEYIRYKGTNFIKDSDNPEIWSIPITFSVEVNNDNYTEYIGADDVQFIPYGSGPGGSLTELPGPWNDPVKKVEYRIVRSDPTINYYRKEFVVTTDPTLGTFTEIRVKNAATAPLGNNTWSVEITESTPETVLGRSEVSAPDFAPTTTPPRGDGELIEGTPSFYYNSLVQG